MTSIGKMKIPIPKSLLYSVAEEISFKIVPPSIFMSKSMTSHLELSEKNMDDAE